MTYDAKFIIGNMIRLLREIKGVSQGKLAEQAGISYQYLSAVENGKENFTIGILESLSTALDVPLPIVITRAFVAVNNPPVVNENYFIKDAILPSGLTISDINSVLNETQQIIQILNSTLRSVTGRYLSDYIQGNSFRGIILNVLTDSFSRLTPYKHNNDQPYPDLINKDNNGATIAGLEVKTTIRPGKGGESHNGHSGWHVIACYKLDLQTGNICFSHIMIASLSGHDNEHAEWKYVGSKVNKETGSQRTETYITTKEGTAKLRHGTVYLDPNLINYKKWRTSTEVVAPQCSPFIRKEQKN